MKKEYKVGDKVKTVQMGECTIVGIDLEPGSLYMYDVKNDLNSEGVESYTSDWKYHKNDAYPSLIGGWQKIPPIIIGRWMLVSDDPDDDWIKRFVVKKVKNRGGLARNGYLAIFGASTEEELAEADDTVIYDYAKELESETEEKAESPEEQIGAMFNKALEEDENCYRRKSR